MGKHAAPTRTARTRARTSVLVSTLPLVLLGLTAGAPVAEAAPARASAVVTPAADGSVPNVVAPDGLHLGD